MSDLAASRARFNEKLKSIKTQARRASYQKKRRDFLKRNPICAVCKLPGTDTVHHQRGRKGDALLDDTHFLACHGHCDRWIHKNPAEAKARGLLLPPKQ